MLPRPIDIVLAVTVIFSCLSCGVVPTYSAQISTSKTGVNSEINFNGPIEDGDAVTFSYYTLSPDTTVILNSPGGRLVDALIIGDAIKRSGARTMVPESAICASACALVWLAGREKRVGHGGRVGFHAAYIDTSNPEISEIGNIAVGDYLQGLGLSYRLIEFATIAGPTEMKWLDADDAAFMDLAVVWE